MARMCWPSLQRAPMADIAWYPARGTAIGHRALPAAAPTASQATEQRRSPFGGAPSSARRPVAIGLQQLLSVAKVLPTHVARMIVQQQNTPLRARLFLAMALPRPPVDDHGLGGCAAVDHAPTLARNAPH